MMGVLLSFCFKYSALKLKNQKHIAVDVLFMGFSTIPLSFSSNLAGRCTFNALRMFSAILYVIVYLGIKSWTD